MAQLHRELYNDIETPRLLAVHGVTGHSRRWERLATETWAARRVMSVDLRGHGYSTSAAPWNLEQHARDLIDTLDAEGWEEPVDVVGHSFGAAIAMTLLALSPGRIRRLVLLDPALMLDGEDVLETAAATVAFEGFESTAEAADSRLSQLDPSGHWAVSTELEQHLAEVESGFYRFRFRVPVVVAAWGEMARSVPTLAERRPTLLVRATQAHVCSDGLVAALRQELGGALFETDLECGHMLYWERFEETGTLVRDFLSAEVPGLGTT